MLIDFFGGGFHSRPFAVIRGCLFELPDRTGGNRENGVGTEPLKCCAIENLAKATDSIG
jgi:hypothetical protein